MLQVGKGEFWITGIISEDKDGVLLSSKGEGRLKHRLKVMVKDDHGKIEDGYDPVFSVSEKIKQVVNSCGDYELLKDFKSGNVNLDDLLGASGNCVIGISKPRAGYDQQSTIECYLRFVKSDSTYPNQMQKFQNKFSATEEGELQF